MGAIVPPSKVIRQHRRARLRRLKRSAAAIRARPGDVLAVRIERAAAVHAILAASSRFRPSAGPNTWPWGAMPRHSLATRILRFYHGAPVSGVFGLGVRVGHAARSHRRGQLASFEMRPQIVHHL
jgi:hypothetical protein